MKSGFNGPRFRSRPDFRRVPLTRPFIVDETVAVRYRRRVWLASCQRLDVGGEMPAVMCRPCRVVSVMSSASVHDETPSARCRR